MIGDLTHESIYMTLANMGLSSYDASGELDDAPFSTDLLVHINSLISVLAQRGVGPKEGFNVTGTTETWYDWLGDCKDVAMIRSYMYMKIRLMFDPPQNSFLVNSLEKMCDEYEWRTGIERDTGEEEID